MSVLDFPPVPVGLFAECLKPHLPFPHLLGKLGLLCKSLSHNMDSGDTLLSSACSVRFWCWWLKEKQLLICIHSKIEETLCLSVFGCVYACVGTKIDKQMEYEGRKFVICI